MFLFLDQTMLEQGAGNLGYAGRRQMTQCGDLDPGDRAMAVDNPVDDRAVDLFDQVDIGDFSVGHGVVNCPFTRVVLT
jgi:hypothetical protein